MRAVERALAVRRRHGIRGVATRAQLEAVAAAHGLEVWERPLAGRVYGFYADGVIVLGQHLLPGTQRLVLGHEIGHALLGHGTAAFEATDGRPPRSRTEADAAVFGFAALLGRPADTMDGLTAQIQRGAAAGLPPPALFAAASVLLLL